MTTTIKGQPPSTEIRKRLKEEGRTVLVSMSLGKDAIATALALQEEAVPFEMAYLYYIPGRDGKRTLDFIHDTINDLEGVFGQKIHLYPHPSLYRWLNNFVFQPPERLAVIEAAQLPEVKYSQLWDLIKQDLDLPTDTWIADGVRAADSIVRRASLSRHGIMKPNNHKVSPIADWLKSEVLDIIERHNITLPIDYEWFGRSFDGIDYRFIEPLSRHAPTDYQRILDWFPLAELELLRKAN
ncbi:phosphoadenosine phosphosulfate reductase [Schaalia sp. ZJ405]|uniref:phosphoadenosine phosphosulfate reductase n=1 Tax=Schaalia sp. ZJ405 TaxID=2709403 RepID=UPI0013ED2C4C|nr:phosphoadenosine phosphosulfate reductase [Schaalia sp. ZJ405]QPK81127.1 phosphoadenosine phosphosulfate reductase [Schaalia sp. ZJ405]